MTAAATVDAAAMHAADAMEAAAYRDLYAAAPTALRGRLGLHAEWREGATVLLAPGLPTPLFNRVIGVDRPQMDDDRLLDAVARLYQDAAVSAWWLHASPAADPAAWVPRLQARGWQVPARRTWAQMRRTTADVPAAPSPLRVGPCHDAEVGATTAAIASAFGLPPFMADWLAALQGRPRWQLFTIADGAQAVGGAALFVDGTRAWLGMGSVLPSHRRRGGQLAAMAARIQAAARSGAVDVFTETGEAVADEANPSLANMRRAGFVQVASRLNLQSP
ncbi:MAG: hypothetical protein U1F56_17050 [Rubrivivax sp.]